MLTSRTGPAGEGFSVLDGVAIVAGAAVASVHVRGLIPDEPAGYGQLLVWGTFAWVGLTATGPFLYLLRKFARKVPNFPRIGDRLWAMIGAPWLVTTMLQNAPDGRGSPPYNEPLALTLSVGLLGVCLIAVIVVWKTWVMVTPGEATQTFSGPWTNKVGLFLAIAWPVQCGVGMVVIG